MMNDNELALCVRKSMDDYFRHLDGEKPSAVYDMVISHVEKPLLQFILDHAQGNQTRAAEILGLNRNTLRKKLKTYGLQ
jgi:Fis family transcriptional regulator